MELESDQQTLVDRFFIDLKNVKQLNYILLGSAGSGKTYLIRHVIENCNFLNIIRLSHQSIAAQLIDGVTIFKFFHFFDGNKSSVVIDEEKFCLEKNKNNEFEIKYSYPFHMSSVPSLISDPIKNLIIIDEISFVSLEILDDINSVLKAVFKNNKIFGGVNFILMGDFYQLKPVSGLPIYYAQNDHFIFSMEYFELNKTRRQTDIEFIRLCKDVKKGKISPEQKLLLQSRSVKNFDPKLTDDLLHIYPRLDMCAEHNTKKLKCLSNIITIKAKDTLNPKYVIPYSEKKNFNGLYDKVDVAIGAKIIITANHETDLGYLNNGEIGVITDIINNEGNGFPSIYVEFSNKNIDKYLIKPIIKKIISKKDNDVMFTREMIPINLAWALTTHKIQGLTLNSGIIHLGKKNFDPVQLYISLTRFKDINSFYLSSDEIYLQKNEDRKNIKKFIAKLKNKKLKTL